MIDHGSGIFDFSLPQEIGQLWLVSTEIHIMQENEIAPSSHVARCME
jgi:hypothetical protein